VVFSGAEIWIYWRHKTGKILQKVLLPCALLTGIIGVCTGVDVRGAFGIYSAFSEFSRIFFKLLIVVPPLAFAHTWVLEIYKSVCNATGANGPFDIGVNQNTFWIVLSLFVLSWIFLVTLASKLMVDNDRLVYGSILWIWGILNCFLNFYCTIRCHSLMTSGQGVESKNSGGNKNGKTKRQLIILKLRLGFLCTFGVFWFCVAATIYHFTFGFNDNLDEFLRPDTEVYRPSFIVILIAVGMAIICIGALFMLGELFGCKAVKNSDPNKSDEAIQTTKTKSKAHSSDYELSQN
jgi:hypothetical protein